MLLYLLSNMKQREIRIWNCSIPTWLLLVILMNLISVPIKADDSSSETVQPQSECELNKLMNFAIARAKTNFCKTYLKEISCEIASNPNFFPSSLPRYCPINNGNFGDVLGCAYNSSLNITGYIGNNFNTSTMCVDFCLKYEAPFAAYDELTGNCNCWIRFNNESTNNIFAINQTCSDWLMDNSDQSVNDTVTIYRTSYAPVGVRFIPEVQPTQTTLVFLFLVTGRKNLRQIKRVIKSIYSPEHYYIIHVDKNEDYLHRELSKLSIRYSNIVLSKTRYRTTWGSTTRLMAELDIFKEIINDFKWDFSFIITISESDFPIKPIEALSEFLSMFPNANFIGGGIPNATELFRGTEAKSIFVFCDKFLYRLANRPLIQNIVYEFGSDWNILNRNFVEYVAHGDDELIRGLRLWFNYTAIPSESFYHTAIVNSMYCDTYIRNNLRMVNWERKRGCTCFIRDTGDLCGCSPLNYRMIHRKLLAESVSKPIFFARKFDPTIDESIVDWIDSKVFGIELSESALYLQNAYHIEDDHGNLDSISGVLKALESYTRMMLVKQPRFHLAQKIELQQIHGVYDLSIFKGYIFHYEIDDHDDFEVFITQNSQTRIFSEIIKQFDIGFTIDTRDTVFIDRSRTFVDPVLVTVLIEWTLDMSDDVLLVMKDPMGNVAQRMFGRKSDDVPIVDILFPVITSTHMTGIWTMDLLWIKSNDTLASLDFLVLTENSMEINGDDNRILDTRIVSKFWPVAGLCSARRESTVCSNKPTKMITVPFEIEECDRNRWSSFYYDVKTNW